MFLVSSFFHEYTVSVPLRMLKPWLFIGFMLNAPLVKEKKIPHYDIQCNTCSNI